MAAVTEGRRLVGTGEAARYLGVDRSTLGRWVAAGIVTPARRTAGGQYRWDLGELDRQLEAPERRNDDGPPFSPEMADTPRHPTEPPI